MFFVGALQDVCNAVFQVNYHVQMGRWKSKSRRWWAGTANVRQRKSQGMKHFVNAMVQVLEKHRAHTVSSADDRFHC